MSQRDARSVLRNAMTLVGRTAAATDISEHSAVCPGEQVERDVVGSAAVRVAHVCQLLVDRQLTSYRRRQPQGAEELSCAVDAIHGIMAVLRAEIQCFFFFKQKTAYEILA